MPILCVYHTVEQKRLIYLFLFSNKVQSSSILLTPRSLAPHLLERILIHSYYSETTSTGANRGLSANQKLILKQRIEHADLTGNCLIFRLVTFNPKFSTFEMAYS